MSCRQRINRAPAISLTAILLGDPSARKARAPTPEEKAWAERPQPHTPTMQALVRNYGNRKIPRKKVCPPSVVPQAADHQQSGDAA